MGYDQVNVVDEILNIIDGIVSWAVKIISIVMNFGIEVVNMVMQMIG